jgi:starvation-inducible DNA-binding protein
MEKTDMPHLKNEVHARSGSEKSHREDERFTQEGNPTASVVERLTSVPGQERRGVPKDVKLKESGISEGSRLEVSEALEKVLADTYVLYLKTQNYHWNVTGPNFLTLHTLFMTQYTDLALAADLIAERIRALGQPTPGTFSEFLEVAAVKEERGVPSAEKMTSNLVRDQELLMGGIRASMPLAEQAQDFTTVDMLTQRLQVHEKNAWMLRSFLPEV